MRIKLHFGFLNVLSLHQLSLVEPLWMRGVKRSAEQCGDAHTRKRVLPTGEKGSNGGESGRVLERGGGGGGGSSAKMLSFLSESLKFGEEELQSPYII